MLNYLFLSIFISLYLFQLTLFSKIIVLEISKFIKIKKRENLNGRIKIRK